jgi:hypothetical protein
MSAQTQNVAAEFAVEVKRKTHSDGTETWRALVKADGSRFSAVSEQALRETLRAHLIATVATRTKTNADALDARLTRVWHVRIVDACDASKAAGDDYDDDDMQLFAFDLFA